MPRDDDRMLNDLRPLVILPNYLTHPEGSALIACGNTKVICTASAEAKVPSFLRGTGKGWVTSEYAMIPRSTGTRTIRESSRGRPSGRTQEIQRLIGRSLRSVVDLRVLGEQTLWIDCDVIQADGGTRAASITGSFVALALALAKLRREQGLEKAPLLDYVAAVSVGIVDGQPRLDLSYKEDSTAEVDMNVVMTGRQLLVEVQGTAEGEPFSQKQLNLLLDLAREGVRQLIERQQSILEEHLGEVGDLFQREPAPTGPISVSDPE